MVAGVAKHIGAVGAGFFGKGGGGAPIGDGVNG
jgi:hypothetical protein